MDFLPPSIASEIAFLLIVLSVLLMVILSVYFANRREADPAIPRTLLVAAGLAFLLTADSAVVASGWLENNPMPALPIFLLGNLAIAAGFALSPLGGVIAGAMPLPLLVGFHAFRLPLELVLHS